MKRYIKYEVELLEPMKLAGQGSQQGCVITRSYIQGSAIRGAFIGAFCKENPQLQIDKSSELRDEFLTGTKFFNVYPAVGDKRTVPVPMAFLMTKAEGKRKGDKRITKRLHTLGAEEAPKGNPVGKDQFAIFHEKKMEIVKVVKTENLHIQKMDKKENEGQMFRYEAMERGQKMIGYLQCEDIWVQDYKELMERQTYYIGGSKGSGYGKCNITFQKVCNYEEYRKELTFNDGDISQNKNSLLVIYALADLILYDERGMVTNHIAEEYLERVLRIQDVKLVEMACDTSVTSGYNQKHRAHAVQQRAVKAGSVFVYQYKGEIEESLLIQLEEDGIGLRREEGYGQILINPVLDCEILSENDSEFVLATNAESNRLENKGKIMDILRNSSKEDVGIVEDTLSKLTYKKQYEKIVYQLVPDKMKQMKEEGDWKISSTQANALYKVLDDMYQRRSWGSTSEERMNILSYLKNQKNLSAFDFTILSRDSNNPISLKIFLERMSEGTMDIAALHKGWKDEVLDLSFIEKQDNEYEKFFESCLYLKELIYNYVREEAE